ncbi:MAG: type II toxin-antitoxin system Phd/YefM family antitoxin [Spirochaetales bacterium]|nr:type II toxin-antitoxin system Phd/YefM family antitoxin [Spirochaetales bacterium]
MHKVAIYEAKNKFTHIVREAEKGEAVELTRHGKPVAVLVGMDRYVELKRDARSFSRVFDEFQTEWSIELEGTGDAEKDPFKNLRPKDSGRDVFL